MTIHLDEHGAPRRPVPPEIHIVMEGTSTPVKPSQIATMTRWQRIKWFAGFPPKCKPYVPFPELKPDG